MIVSCIRVEKSRNFTVMCNEHLKNIDLSLKAKGLLSMVLSLPDEWNYSVEGLTSICKESKHTVESALSELKDNGYLIVIKKKPNETTSGRFEYEYVFYEKSQKQEPKKQGVEIQGVEIQGVEIQGVENCPQLNTKELNTKELNKDKLNTKKSNQACVYFPNDETLNDAFGEYVKFRKKIKSPMTDRAINLAIKKLDELSNGDNDLAIKIIDQSIMNGWKGLFELQNNLPRKAGTGTIDWSKI